MGKNKESAKGSACFSLIPKLKTKSSHKKAVMARETFTSTNKAATNYSPELVLVVSLLAKEQSTAVRKCFNLLNNNAGQEPSESNIKSWGFDSSESRNIIKIAKGIYDSQHELHESNYIPDIKSDIRSLQKRIKSTKSKLSKAKSRAKKYKFKKRLFNLQNQLNKTKQRLSKLQASFNQSKYSVCFGTKDLQRKFTRNLNSAKNNNKSIDINNAYQSYLVNKAKWDSKRNSEFFFEGHANQKAGNQKVKLIERSDGLFDLNIHIPKRLQPEVVKIVNLKSGVASFEAINFGSGRNYQDLLIALTPIVSIEHTKTGKTKNRQSTKYPISHRLKLVMDSNGTMGVDVISTIKIDKAPIVSNRNNGSLGVDVNQHSLDWTIVDHLGNYKCSGSIHLSTQDRNSNQTKDAIYKATKKIIGIALKHNVILTLEGLKFKNNSERFTSKKFARMASNLPFSQIQEAFQQQAYRFGITIKYINPAFTSIIGLYKYMVPLGLNSGTAAGLVIARRGLGLRAEKIPHYLFSAGFSLDDEIAATSWTAWGRLAKWRKTIGGFNRHIFFTFSRLHRVNCPCEDGSTTPSEVSLASS